MFAIWMKICNKGFGHSSDSKKEPFKKKNFISKSPKMRV